MALGQDSLDAYKPAVIARLVEDAAIAKVALPTGRLLALAVLAGAFIALGGAFFLAVLSGADPGHGPTRLAAGTAFALGLVLVIVGGAELFTGNALMVMAAVDGLIGTGQLLRNWALVFLGNLAGALAIAALMRGSGLLEAGLGDLARRVAEAKMALGWSEAVCRGALCNALVCLAVWLTFSARSAGGKTLVILLPIAAFVALGFEHSVANMFLIPLGIAAGAEGGWREVAANLVPVTIGNVLGGAGGVALAYWCAYGPDRPPKEPGPAEGGRSRPGEGATS